MLIKTRTRFNDSPICNLLKSAKALIINSGVNKYQNAKKPNVVTDMTKTIVVQVIRIVRSELRILSFCFFII